MNSSKYIKFDFPDAGPTIIIFPSTVSHRDMAKMVGHPVLTAGFVKSYGTELKVFGGSESLGVLSNLKADDQELELQHSDLFFR